MAITGTGKTTVALWGGPTQFFYDADFSKEEGAVVEAGGGPYRKKREDPDALREAARLALLRRRKREALEAERQRALKATTPENAQSVQKRLHKLDEELVKIHEEMIELEIDIAKKKKRRRKRDKVAALLLIN